jgi:integrase
VSVAIKTSREVKGKAWAARYPDKATDLWVVAVHGGRRERKHIGPDTVANRERAAHFAAQMRSLFTGDAARTTKLAAPTLREAGDAYLVHAKKRLAPATLRARQQQLDHLCHELGSVRIDRLRPDHLTTWWASYVEDGDRSPRTGHGHLEALRVTLEDAEFHGAEGAALEAVDTARRRIQRRTRKTKQSRVGQDSSLTVAPLTPAEAAALGQVLEDWPDHDARLFTVLALDAGLRLGELLALRWSDFDGQRLRIHRSLDAFGNLGPTKTGRERTVELSRRARKVLKERRLEVGLRGRPASRILRWVTWDVYRRKLVALAEAAGITSTVTPTTLRHSFGSLLVMAGVPLSYVASQLGHASIAVTEKHYARWIPTEAWRTPPALVDGEVPADLLVGSATTLPPSATTAEKDE